MEGSCCFVQKLALYAFFSLNIHLSARFKSHCAVWVPPALDSANLAEHSVRRKPRGSIFSIRHAAFFQNAPLRHSACSARKTALFAAAPPFPVTPPRRSAARKLGRTRHLPKASQVHFSLSGTRCFPKICQLRSSACSARKTALSANAKRAVIIENPV